MLYQLLNKLKVNDAIHSQLTFWLNDSYYSVNVHPYRKMMINDSIDWTFWEHALATREFQEELYKWNQKIDKEKKVTPPGNCTSPDRVPPAGLQTARDKRARSRSRRGVSPRLASPNTGLCESPRI